MWEIKTWDSLQNRRNKHKLTILYKILNGLTPESILPPLVQNTTNYNLRISNNLRSIHANTNLFYNSFFPSTIRAWNDLSEDIKNSPSVAAFKYRLNRDTHPPSKYFNAGSRMDQILHARIRMECSALNSHLCRKKNCSKPLMLMWRLLERISFLFQKQKQKQYHSRNSSHQTIDTMVAIEATGLGQ